MTAGSATAGKRAARQQRGRTVLLGLDAFDLLLLQRWAAEGRLPFFRRLLDECPLVRLTALSRVLQESIWPSILSGLSPGHHGHFNSTQLQTGTYNLDKEAASRIQGERFYERLAKHGIRSAVVDVPTDYPDPHFNGIQVVDWGTEFKGWQFTTHPPDLKREIETRFGKHLLTDYGTTGSTPAAHRTLHHDLLKAVRVKSAFTRDLLDREDLDVVLVVFGEPHKAGHFLWKYMDASHPDHAPAERDLHGALLAQYELIDKECGELAGGLSPQDNLIVFTDHGMQANYRGEHFVPAVLQRLGLCKTEQDARLSRGGAASLTTIESVGLAMRRSAHELVRRVTPQAVAQRLRARFGAAARVDWSTTRVFSLPTDRNSYLRINLRGREPQGCVAPGSEYDALLDYIENEFRALKNGETGKPAVEDVFRAQQLYPGPRAHDLPDLTILWSSDSPINVLQSESLGRLENPSAEERSGNHRPEGFLLARGPAFRTGRAELPGDILQIAPTVLALHEVPIPAAYAMGPLVDLMVPRGEGLSDRVFSDVPDRASA
jgi:predicted AlkP superfamily phosphohydrolase/phosphomutase